MKTFFTADLHFESPSLYGTARSMRPFQQEAWDQMMVDTINRQVARTDRLCILGDFAAKRPGYWRMQLRCKNILMILGNHDNETKLRNIFGGNLKHTCDIKILENIHVFLSHYPHAFWNGSHKGWLHLYGHNHSQQEATLDAIWPERRAMDVSPENAYEKLGDWRAFTDEEVYWLVGKRNGHDPVCFYHAYQENWVAKFKEKLDVRNGARKQH